MSAAPTALCFLEPFPALAHSARDARLGQHWANLWSRLPALGWPTLLQRRRTRIGNAYKDSQVGASHNEIVRFKDPSFEGKRMAACGAANVTQAQRRGRTTTSIQNRQGEYYSLRELRLKEGALLPVQSVRYGPTLKQKQAVNSLSLLFRQKGYLEPVTKHP